MNWVTYKFKRLWIILTADKEDKPGELRLLHVRYHDDRWGRLIRERNDN